MARKISVGIDIGTYHVKVMVAENTQDSERGAPKIIGTGFAESKGLRHGYIINQSDVIKSIRIAVSQAEKASGIRIKKALLSIGGIGLSGIVGAGTTIISRADSEITDLDIEKALETSRANIPPSASINRKIIHTIPLQYKIDGKPVLGNKPLAMKASKLEVRTLFITCLEHHLRDLEEAVEEVGIEVVDVVASPIAASLVTLTKAQKIAGCVLANIGSETVSIVVFENNIPMSLEVFPIGSNDITNDIALGLKMPLDEAEQVKLGILTSTTFPRKKLEDIVLARLSDIFELIEGHLKKIGRSGLLPAGIIITGGGSGITSLEDLAKSSLNLPSKISSLRIGGSVKETLKDATWSVVYGLCILGMTQEKDSAIGGIDMFDGVRKNITSWIKQFLP